MADIRYNSTQVTIECEHAGPIVYKHFPRYALWLGSVQIICSIILLILSSVCLLNGGQNGVYGFEILLPAILAGAFGIAAGKSKGVCQITTTMIFSILTSIFSCAVVVLLMEAFRTIRMVDEGFDYETRALQRAHGIYSHGESKFLIAITIFALIECVTSIVLSAIGCHFSCFCCKNCCCRFDLTTSEKILVRDVSQEQQLQMIGLATPAGSHQLAPHAPQHYDGKDRERLIQPPAYSN